MPWVEKGTVQNPRACPGFEPGTSRTRSENHTPRPQDQAEERSKCCAAQQKFHALTQPYITARLTLQIFCKHGNIFTRLTTWSCSVVVITSVLHTEGPGIEPQRDHELF